LFAPYSVHHLTCVLSPLRPQSLAMTAADIVTAYLDALDADPAWAETYCRSNALYTPLATAALVKAGFTLFPGAEHTAKEHHDRWQRSEYLTLDVVLCDPETWGCPLYIAEHENSRWKSKIQYDAWKLLAVDAQRRVLVAYWGADKEISTFEKLRDAVAEVARDNPKRDILLIAADYKALPADGKELRAMHRSAIVGHWTT
jgi:hypothetical protein